MSLALPRLGREVLGFGLQALRRQGMRPAKITRHSSLRPASLKRYVVLRDGEPRASVTSRRLLREHEEALVLYWCQVIAQWKPVAPVVPGRRLLDGFCPICLHAPTPHARSPLPAVEDGVRSLVAALTLGTACCVAGVRPCVQAPARFAALVSQLHVHAEEAAAFLSRMETSLDGSAEPLVHPDRVWVRLCLSCEMPAVTDARDDHPRLCRRHLPRSD
jgi:hypothetical protein